MLKCFDKLILTLTLGLQIYYNINMAIYVNIDKYIFI